MIRAWHGSGQITACGGAEHGFTNIFSYVVRVRQRSSDVKQLLDVDKSDGITGHQTMESRSKEDRYTHRSLAARPASSEDDVMA